MIMPQYTEEALEILEEALNSALWQSWEFSGGVLQFRFTDTRLYDRTKNGRQARSAGVTLRSEGNPFCVFLDDIEDDPEDPWYIRFQEQRLLPDGIIIYDLVFDDSSFCRAVIEDYPDRTVQSGEMKKLLKAGRLLAVSCPGFGFIAGSRELTATDSTGILSSEEITGNSERWWQYWEEYHVLKDTPQAYETDQTCEDISPAGDMTERIEKIRQQRGSE